MNICFPLYGDFQCLSVFMFWWKAAFYPDHLHSKLPLQVLLSPWLSLLLQLFLILYSDLLYVELIFLLLVSIEDYLLRLTLLMMWFYFFKKYPFFNILFFKNILIWFYTTSQINLSWLLNIFIFIKYLGQPSTFVSHAAYFLKLLAYPVWGSSSGSPWKLCNTMQIFYLFIFLPRWAATSAYHYYIFCYKTGQILLWQKFWTIHPCLFPYSTVPWMKKIRNIVSHCYELSHSFRRQWWIQSVWILITIFFLCFKILWLERTLW